MNHRRKKKNWLEWAVFTTGLLLVGALVAYLVYDIWTDRSGPPDVHATAGAAVARGDRYTVPVEVENRGHQVAEQVHIEVVLNRGTQTEKANFVIQFLPRGATRHGAVSFTTDPRLADRVTARVLGYERP